MMLKRCFSTVSGESLSCAAISASESGSPTRLRTVCSRSVRTLSYENGVPAVGAPRLGEGTREVRRARLDRRDRQAELGHRVRRLVDEALDGRPLDPAESVFVKVGRDDQRPDERPLAAQRMRRTSSPSMSGRWMSRTRRSGRAAGTTRAGPRRPVPASPTTSCPRSSVHAFRRTSRKRRSSSTMAIFIRLRDRSCTAGALGSPLVTGMPVIGPVNTRRRPPGGRPGSGSSRGQA
jgi:hypothetical protein